MQAFGKLLMRTNTQSQHTNKALSNLITVTREVTRYLSTTEETSNTFYIETEIIF